MAKPSQSKHPLYAGKPRQSGVPCVLPHMRKNLKRDEAEKLLDVIADKMMRNIFGEYEQETLEELSEQRNKAWHAFIASQPTEEHLIDLITRQNGMASSLNLGRLKFHELEERIKKLEDKIAQ